MVGAVRYAVTVEPHDRYADRKVPPVRATVEADGKDEALDRAEADYRRKYPSVGKLRSSVVRLQPLK